MLEEALRGADQREADALHDARMAQRERCRRDPADDDTTIDAAKTVKPIQLSSLRAGIDVVEVVEQPGGEHKGDVDHDEQQEPDQHQEMQGSCRLDAEHPADPLEAGGQGR